MRSKSNYSRAGAALNISLTVLLDYPTNANRYCVQPTIKWLISLYAIVGDIFQSCSRNIYVQASLVASGMEILNGGH